jgi:hypothetical protein
MNDQKWREVMLYTVALLPNADSILEEMRRQLIGMKHASSGVLIFLAHCYCESRPDIASGRVRPDSPDYYYFGLKGQIEDYISDLRQPSLTTSELAKFTEHIEVLHAFLRTRISRVGYENSFGVVQAAAKYLKSDPLDAGRLLGGYFIKPEQFISFFYACRLFIECLEVAITARRESFLSDVLEFAEKDRERVEAALRVNDLRL